MPSDSNRETRMPPLRQILAVLALGASLASQTAVAAECPYPGKVVFAGLNWESGMFTTDLLRYVLEKGYGCETDALPGNTVTMENALRQNDIQVTGEQWAGRSPVWRAAEEAGEVFSVGETVKGATEGWWVPEYLVKGDPQRGIEAKAPELRSVADLPRYKALFRAARLYLTRVGLAPEGDAFFPEIDGAAWRLASSIEHAAADDAPAYAFEVWERR